MRRSMLLATMIVAATFSAGVSPAAAVPGIPDGGAPRQKQSPPPEGDCAGGIMIAEQLCDGAEAVGGAVGGAIETVKGAPGAVAGAVSGGVFAEATRWMTDGANWVTKQIQALMDATTTPELTAGWYRERWRGMVALGAGLAALVAMMALGSAALRRDPDALGETLIGMFRAGLGTGLVIPLVVMALGVADWITNFVVRDVTGGAGAAFWGDVSKAWEDGGGGFGSAAIEFFFALLNVLAGIAVWLEMLVRNAGIYVAVLFMAVALAASIWPRLGDWQTRLTQLLFVLIATKPVIVVILSLAGSAAVAGGAGPERDYGILLAAIMILVLAALTPWVLMMIVSFEHGASTAGFASSALRGSAARGAGRVGGGLGRAGRAVGRGAGRASNAIGGRLGAGRSGGGASPSGGGGGARGGGGPGGGPAGGGSSSGGGGKSGGSPGGAPRRGGGPAAGTPRPAGAVAAAAGLVPPPAKSPGGRSGSGGGSGARSTRRGGLPVSRPSAGPGAASGPAVRPASPGPGATRPAGRVPRSGGQR